MQLHVVTGNANQPYSHYATTRHHTHVNANARPNYGYIQENYIQDNTIPAAVKYTERGVPEGAASVTQSDCSQHLLPTTSNATQASTTNNTQTSNTSTTAQQQNAVFYAMNV